MFKYMLVLALAIAFVVAAKEDQDTASQFYYGGYPSYGYSAYSAYPYASVGHYGGLGYGYGHRAYYG